MVSNNNRKSLKVVLSLCIFLFFVIPVNARSLYWESFDVEAHLDKQGALHVKETQHYVFNGAWNGGERPFKIKLGQELEIESLYRIDPETGERKRLTKGSLDNLDHYKLNDDTLRWRSRYPGAPVFHKKHIIYELNYVLSGILLVEQKNYRLEHSFVFKKRDGQINKFRLQLSLDPAWSALSTYNKELTYSNLLPGKNVILTIPLAYLLPGKPSAVKSGISYIIPVSLILVFIVFVIWRLSVFFST